jgi:hypothetical protein
MGGWGTGQSLQMSLPWEMGVLPKISQKSFLIAHAAKKLKCNQV